MDTNEDIEIELLPNPFTRNMNDAQLLNHLLSMDTLSEDVKSIIESHQRKPKPVNYAEKMNE